MKPAASGPESLLEFEGVSLGYGSRTVLSGIDLAIREGTFLGIVGPNGSGKTTFLRAVIGLLEPRAGRIRRARAGRLRIGYVPQRQALDPIYPLRVRDIVMMGLHREIGYFRRPGRAHAAKVDSALDAAGIRALSDRLYRDLSGGQQQRTLIARALVSDPELLVLDEPTNDMDLAGERSVMGLIESLHRQQGRTVLAVSHLLHVLCRYVEELALIDRGRVVAGSIESIATPETLGRIYGIPVKVAKVDGELVILAARGGGGEPAP